MLRIGVIATATARFLVVMGPRGGIRGGDRAGPLDRAIRVALVALVAVYAAVLLLGSDRFLQTAALPHYLFNAPFALAAIAAVRSARRAGAARRAWLAIGAAMASYLAANLYAVHLVADGVYPSPADALWLLSYVFAAAGLVLLARAQIAGVTRAALLDGAIAGTVAMATAAVLVTGRLIEAGDDNLAVVLTNVAYPVADLVLLGVLVTTTKLVARIDLVRVLLAAGFTSLFVADSIFLWQTAHGTWVPQTLAELFFVGSAALVGLAATVARSTEPLAAAPPHPVVLTVGGVVGFGLLVWGQVAEAGSLAMALTTAALGLVGIRLWSALNQLRSSARTAERSPARLAQIDEVRHALRAGQIVAHYQPQVDLATGRVVGVEALARWAHPARGIVGPHEFLPLLAEGGLLPDLTEVMLRQAIEAGQAFRRHGHDLATSVNISTPELARPALLAAVGDLIVRRTVGASMLTLEITEESVIADRDLARRVVAELRRHGVRVAVDDYGIGHASLSYLRDLPLDEVKLDRSFVIDGWRDERAAAIVASTVELAHELHLSIVAEGIEDAQTNSWLRTLGCDVGQGFFHSRPMPLADLLTWLDERSQPSAGG